MDKENRILQLIKEYKEKIYISKLEDEKYKWELLNKYNSRPNINSNDFFKELKSIKFGNLIYHNAKTVIINLAKKYPEDIRALFEVLLNEDEDLELRIKTFNEETLKLYRKIDEKFSHHQDERSISTYLTFYNSNKYTFYKNSFYTKYCEFLGIKKAKKNQKYVHYLELINDLIDNYIVKDEELIEQIRKIIPEYYDGTNHKILAQDILYQIFDQQPKEFIELKNKFDEEIFRVYEFYLTKVITELNLSIHDERLVFSVGKDQLNFTIGQRYCFNLYLSNVNGIYGIISKDKLLENSESFSGDSADKPFYNYYKDFGPTENEWKSMISAMKTELNRTAKSGFLKHNNVDFEEYIFKKKKLEGKEMPSLNTILYGPPGTGKTYNTINKAIEIIDNKFYLENKDEVNARDLLKKKFEEYRIYGQIEFVTFHQSYGYEEFVEGIKADLKNDDVKYKLEDGIFKKISIEALFENLIFDDFQKDLNYTELYEVLLTKFKKENFLELKSKDNKTIELRDISNKENLYCYHHDSDVKHTVGKDRLKKLYDVYNSIDDLNKLSGFHEEFTNIIGGANQTIYWTILNQLLIYKEELKKEESDENIDYEIKKDLISNNPKTKFKQQSKNYILIIDEINRGNISKIFGELITLIEDSKRLGEIEQIEITLPYSGEKFAVPNNLYILGTMNTADRSIAPIDTALRRRFVFEEMSPKPSLLIMDCEGISLQELLEAINTRIEYLYDRDHTIGHAYLIDVKTLDDLRFTFKNKIIPLLSEYFYEDWENIKLVLNDNKFIIEEQNENIYLSNIKSENRMNGKRMYNISDEKTWGIDNFKKIYDNSINLKKEDKQTDEQESNN